MITSLIMPGYEPEMKLYVNHSGGANRAQRRMYVGFLCQAEKVPAIDPNSASKLTGPCHDNKTPTIVKHIKAKSTHLCFLLGETL